MGGRALLQYGIETIRIDRKEFDELTKTMESSLIELFNYVKVIPFYNNKADFGDMDILVSQIRIDEVDIRKELQRKFSPKVIVHNGNVWSFDQNNFQIDIIISTVEHWHTTKTYYSYNDLGNLMGRIARSMGFRYGHKGLTFQYKSKYGFSYGETVISKEPKIIFRFLGFDYDKFLDGFDELEDIFKFVTDSTYFDIRPFQYENLDHVNRVRNSKRDSYRKFLLYIERIAPKPPVTWGKLYHFQRAVEFFGAVLRDILKACEYADEELNSVRQKFNGNIIMELVPISGKELGEFINLFKNNIPNNFNEYVLSTDEEEIEKDILNFYNNAFLK